jgi:RNA polymerase sigma-70 factor (ECF subfamily)
VARPEFIDVDDETNHFAFSTFYDAHYADLVRALSATLGDAGWGREAADEAMTRAFDRWNDVGGYANPAGWTYRVGLNWARSWHRKIARRLPWTEDAIALPYTPDVALDEAIAQLDVKYRAVVVCRYLFDWSTDETAAALGIAPGTVKSRLSVALDKLHQVLDETPVDPDRQGR